MACSLLGAQERRINHLCESFPLSDGSFNERGLQKPDVNKGVIPLNFAKAGMNLAQFLTTKYGKNAPPCWRKPTWVRHIWTLALFTRKYLDLVYEASTPTWAGYSMVITTEYARLANPGRASYDWVKNVMTDESRLRDWIDCGEALTVTMVSWLESQVTKEQHKKLNPKLNLYRTACCAAGSRKVTATQAMS